MGISASMMPAVLGWLFDRWQLGEADTRALERNDSAIGMIDAGLPGDLNETAGIPGATFGGQNFAGGGLNLDDAFGAWNEFQSRDPGFNPVTAGQLGNDPNLLLGYNPMEMRNFGQMISGGLNQMGGSLANRLNSDQADFSGVMSRIEDRFPDQDAFMADRLGAISDAAGKQTQLQKQSTLAQFGGDLQAAGGALDNVKFDVARSSQLASNQVSSAAENIRNQQATTLGGIDSALSQFARGDRTNRALAGAGIQSQLGGMGANIASQMFGQGEQFRQQSADRALSAGQFDIGNQIQTDFLNQTIPFDQAQIAAGFRSGVDQDRISALMNLLGIRSGNAQAGAGLNLQGAMGQAGIESGFSENLALLSPLIMQLMNWASGGPEQKDGFNVAVFGTGGGTTCVWGQADILMGDGKTKKLCDVRIGDSLMTPDGDMRRVVSRDYGIVPLADRDESHVRIQTVNRIVVITSDHPIDGKPAKDWKVGQLLPVMEKDGTRGEEKIRHINEHAYVISGDLMLEGNAQYIANGVPITSVLGMRESARNGTRDMTRYATMPLGVVDAFEDPLPVLRRYIKHQDGRKLDKEIACIDEHIGTISLDDSRDIANKWLDDNGYEKLDAEFIKEGHTSTVFVSESANLVINVARDATTAAEDLRRSFCKLQQNQTKAPGSVAKVVIVENGKYPVAVCEYRPRALELVRKGHCYGAIERFNGLNEPDVIWFGEETSGLIENQLSRLIKTLGLDVSVSHGDVTIEDDGRLVIVACDDPDKKHFRTYANFPDGTKEQAR